MGRSNKDALTKMAHRMECDFFAAEFRYSLGTSSALLLRYQPKFAWFTWNKATITTIDYGNGYPNTYLAGINDGGLIVGE
jgi:hypothetical protein